MKKMKKGFTLIELLVVVLIIGILAAVALPQYQRAVKKTKLVKYFPLAASIAAAEEVFFMSNAKYTPFAADLSVVLPKGASLGTGNDDGYIFLPDKTTIDLQGSVSYYGKGNVNSYVMILVDGLTYKLYFKQSAYPGRRWCGGDKKICNSLGAQTAETGGWIWPEN